MGRSVAMTSLLLWCGAALALLAAIIGVIGYWCGLLRPPDDPKMQPRVRGGAPGGKEAE